MATVKPTWPYVAVSEDHDGKGLMLHMPDGIIVPGQLDMTLTQSMDEFQNGIATATISFLVNVKK